MPIIIIFIFIAFLELIFQLALYFMSKNQTQPKNKSKQLKESTVQIDISSNKYDNQSEEIHYIQNDFKTTLLQAQIHKHIKRCFKEYFPQQRKKQEQFYKILLDKVKSIYPLYQILQLKSQNLTFLSKVELLFSYLLEKLENHKNSQQKQKNFKQKKMNELRKQKQALKKQNKQLNIRNQFLEKAQIQKNKKIEEQKLKQNKEKKQINQQKEMKLYKQAQKNKKQNSKHKNNQNEAKIVKLQSQIQKIKYQNDNLKKNESQNQNKRNSVLGYLTKTVAQICQENNIKSSKLLINCLNLNQQNIKKLFEPINQFFVNQNKKKQFFNQSEQFLNSTIFPLSKNQKNLLLTLINQKRIEKVHCTLQPIYSYDLSKKMKNIQLDYQLIMKKSKIFILIETQNQKTFGWLGSNSQKICQLQSCLFEVNRFEQVGYFPVKQSSKKSDTGFKFTNDHKLIIGCSDIQIYFKEKKGYLNIGDQRSVFKTDLQSQDLSRNNFLTKCPVIKCQIYSIDIQVEQTLNPENKNDLKNCCKILNESTQQIIKNLTQQNQKLLSLNQNLMTEAQNLKQKVKIQQQSNNTAFKKELQKNNQESKGREKQLSDKISALQKKILLNQKQIRQKQQNLTKEKQNFNLTNENLRDQAKLANEKLQITLVKIKQQEQKNRKLQEDINEIKSKNIYLQQQQKKLKNNQTESFNELNKIKEQRDRLLKQCQRIENQLKTKNQQYQNSINQIEKINIQKIQQKENQIKQSQFQKQILIKKLNESQQKLNQLKLTQQSMSQKILESQKFINENKAQKQKLIQKIGQNQIQLDQVKIQNKSLNQKIKKIQQQAKKFQLNQYSHQVFFNQDILFKEKVMKSFIIQSLQKQIGKKIVKTRNIYRFDFFKRTDKNLINLHRFIDTYPNIFLLIKTENGRIIGVFSQDRFEEGVKATGKGILMALKKPEQGLSKYYITKPGSPSITYDTSVIFGNSDLKIFSNSSKIIINSNQVNTYFESNRISPDQFLGMGSKRECNMQNYQFYALQFENEEQREI